MDSRYPREYGGSLGEVITVTVTFSSHMESDHGKFLGRKPHERLNDIAGLITVTDGKLFINAPLLYFLPLSVDLPVTFLNGIEISLTDIVKQRRYNNSIILELKKA